MYAQNMEIQAFAYRVACGLWLKLAWYHRRVVGIVFKGITEKKFESLDSIIFKV